MAIARVAGLKTVLQDIEETRPTRTLDEKQLENLESLRNSCLTVLEDLDRLLGKYTSLSSESHDNSSRSRRVWDRFKFDQKVVQDLRNRIVSNTNLLNTFLASLDR